MRLSDQRKAPINAGWYIEDKGELKGPYKSRREARDMIRFLKASKQAIAA